MATLEQLKTLARHSAHGTAPENFSAETVSEAFRGELAKFCGSINEFNKNRYDLYDIIIENADEIVPKNVIAALSPFAEIKTVAQGQKVMFKKSLGKARAKAFLTRVGLSGVYETFRLDKATFEVETSAIGIGATIDFERMLDGAEDMADVMEVVTTSLTEGVFGEVQKALRAGVSAAGRPTANYVVGNYDSAKMFKLCSVAKAYGEGAVIFAPPEFVGAMGPDDIVPMIAGAAQGIYSPEDIEAIHRTGYINLFRGTPIVQIPQSFTDESNTTTYIDPQIAYILPTGKQKIVKIAIEGNTQINDFKNRDNSMEVYAYKKFGVAILSYHDWCQYQNTSIPQTYVDVYNI